MLIIKRSGILLHRFVLFGLLLIVLVAPLVQPAGSLAAEDAPPPSTPGEAVLDQGELPLFLETGFRIGSAQFADYFAKRGGVRTFGYPVSRSFLFLGTEVQFFQRQIMQLRPDGAVGTLNILDEDLMPYTRINGSVFPAASAAVLSSAPDPGTPDYATRVINFVRVNAPDVWNGLPANFNHTFLNTVRYEEAFPDRAVDPGIMPSINLELWGLPTSLPAPDPTNGAFAYLRFQRGIMHFDAATGLTQGLLLADYLKSILTGEGLPPDLEEQARGSRFFRQYDPGRPHGLARPAQLPGTDLTGAFVASDQPVTARPMLAAPPFDPNRLAHGMAVHLWYQDKPRVTGLVRDAGFGWIAQQVRWADVERVRDAPDFSELDAMVDTALRSDLNVLFTVVGAPLWARADGRTNGPPDDVAEYGRFIGLLASRYKNQVRAYEVWNEQNLAIEWAGSRIDAGQYVELLKAAYPAVKTADPAALVITGALTPTGFNDPNTAVDDVLYLEQMYQYQGGIVRQVSDAVGAHAGGFNNPPEDDPSRRTGRTARFKDHWSFYFRRIEQLHDVMVKYSDTQKKMWVTEFGWSTSNAATGYEYGVDNTEADQASYLVRAYALAKSRYPWLGAMFVWNLNFATLPELPPTDEKVPFSLLNRDFSPRPSYLGLRSLPK